MQVTSPSTGFSCVHAGPLADWRRHEFTHPALGRVPGKAFLQEALGLSGLEMSLSTIGPGRGIPFLHRHRRNEEVYVFLEGRGQFQVDGHVVDVTEGSVVRVAPAGARAYRNTGDGPLTFLVIQAPADSGISRTIADGEPLDGPVTWPGD